MNLNELALKQFNQHRERKIGRYSATDIYKIRRKDLTPENFFDDNEVDHQGLKNIFRGLALEDALLKLFDDLKIEQVRNGEQQLKLVWDVEKDCPATKETKIELVMKPDFVFKNDKGEYIVLETKCPNKIKDTVPPWYQDQLECQYRMLKEYLKAEPKVYLTIINIYQNDYPLLLHIPYKPSEVRWKNILNIIKKFDNDNRKTTSKNTN